MAQESGDLMTCEECGNTVSMLYTEYEGDIYCLMCYDTLMEAKDEEKADDQK